MDTTHEIERFIAHKRSERDGTGGIAPLPPGTLPFVTVSSQSGAGGHRFTEILMERLARDAAASESLRDWRVFDKSMCQHVLEREHLAEAMNDLLHEDYHSQVDEFVLGIFGDRGMQNAAYMRLARVLRTLASIGKVVVLGHGGSLATRELAGGVHVRLVAPASVRAARMAPLLGVDEAKAARMIRKRDKQQRRLLKTHYRVDGADPEHYDLVFNTARVSPRMAVDMVMALLHEQTDWPVGRRA